MRIVKTLVTVVTAAVGNLCRSTCDLGTNEEGDGVNGVNDCESGAHEMLIEDKVIPTRSMKKRKVSSSNDSDSFLWCCFDWTNNYYYYLKINRLVVFSSKIWHVTCRTWSYCIWNIRSSPSALWYSGQCYSKSFVVVNKHSDYSNSFFFSFVHKVSVVVVEMRIVLISNNTWDLLI